MNRRYYWDNKRGLATIRQSPNAHNYPSVDEVKQMVAGVDMDEEDSCPVCGQPIPTGTE